jgi:ferredoxin
MRVRIDHEACTGHGRCYDLAPELFTDDERGYGQVIGEGIVTDDTGAQALAAVRACPEHAVSIDED